MITARLLFSDIILAISVIVIVVSFLTGLVSLKTVPDQERVYYNGYVDGKVNCENLYGFPPPSR